MMTFHCVDSSIAKILSGNRKKILGFIALLLRQEFIFVLEMDCETQYSER